MRNHVTFTQLWISICFVNPTLNIFQLLDTLRFSSIKLLPYFYQLIFYEHNFECIRGAEIMPSGSIRSTMNLVSVEPKLISIGLPSQAVY